MQRTVRQTLQAHELTAKIEPAAEQLAEQINNAAEQVDEQIVPTAEKVAETLDNGAQDLAKNADEKVLPSNNMALHSFMLTMSRSGLFAMMSVLCLIKSDWVISHTCLATVCGHSFVPPTHHDHETVHSLEYHLSCTAGGQGGQDCDGERRAAVQGGGAHS